MDYVKQFMTNLDFFIFPGVYRMACEVTMQLLRDNKDSLMSVLDAFIYDPLVEWEDEKRKLVVTNLSQVWKYRFFLMNDLYRSGSLLKRTLQKTRLTCTPLLNLP
jgi:phosphatidylinositol kinase/protein kinase (PI-3  family)